MCGTSASPELLSEQLTAALHALAGIDPAAITESSTMSDAEVISALGGVGKVRRLIDAVGVRLAGVVARSDQGVLAESMSHRLGERSAAAVVAREAGIDQAEAAAWCTVGDRVLPRMSLVGEQLPAECEATADALANGTLSVSAARTITSTLHEIAPAVDQVTRQGIERALLEHAPSLTARELGKLCRALPDQFQPEDAELREQRLREKSGLYISRTPDGLVKWTVLMHPEAAGYLTTALDARTAPRRQPTFTDVDDPDERDPELADDRTLAQKRLDALVALGRESLTHDPGQVAGTAVTMVVTVGLDELRSGLGVAHIEGVDEPISAATARRLAVQASIVPAVLGGKSEVLDLGRGARLFSQAQRRALALRDGHCVWPGCNAPPGWCEIAHIIAWVLGGPTDMDNAALMCPYHHRRFDLDGWQLERHDGAPYLIPPAWVDPTRTPRRGGRLPDVAA